MQSHSNLDSVEKIIIIGKDIIFNKLFKKIKLYISNGWGLGIGDWGLGPIPNPQSPIPNPQFNETKFHDRSFNVSFYLLPMYACFMAVNKKFN
jgi:hypothetical protein